MFGLLGTIIGVSISIKGLGDISSENISIGMLSTGLNSIFSGLGNAVVTTLIGVFATISILLSNFFASLYGNKFWQTYYPIAKEIHRDFYPAEKNNFKDEDVIKQLSSISNIQTVLNEAFSKNADINRQSSHSIEIFKNVFEEVREFTLKQNVNAQHSNELLLSIWVYPIFS